MLDIKTTMTQSEINAVQVATDWTDAVHNLVNHYTTIGKPFSSGELVSRIREVRKDFIFSATKVGDEVRYMFKTCMCNMARVQQYERYTKDGQLVFVYAPNKWSGETYDFEIDSSSLTVSPTVQNLISHWKLPTTTLTPTPKKVKATISTDGRLCLGKELVKDLMAKQGVFDGLFFVHDANSPVGIKFISKIATANAFVPFKSVEQDGRIRIKIPHKFQPGTYDVELSKIIG